MVDARLELGGSSQAEGEREQAAPDVTGTFDAGVQAGLEGEFPVIAFMVGFDVITLIITSKKTRKVSAIRRIVNLSGFGIHHRSSCNK